MKLKTVLLGPDRHLTAQIVATIALDSKIKVALSPIARKKVQASRKTVENMVREKRVVYGVTTGFGNFKNKFISPEDAEELQKNLIRSHAAGVGEPFSKEIVRAALIVRLNSLSQGYSGVRLELLDLLVEIINRNIVPLTPSQGSVGSSGDLAPLSHMGLLLMGEGEAYFDNTLMSGKSALEKAGLKPITFAAKEGLAWNNGTSVMTGVAALGITRAKHLIELADLSCALTAEALCATKNAFDARVHAIRPHPGQIKAAENIRKYIKGSKLIDSIPNRIQDAYSIRCSPQVHGAIRDAIAYVDAVIERELNAATDNPLIFSKEDEALSGGNFHGEPIAIAMDTFGIAIAELADISERRTAKLVDSSTSEGLPMFLIAGEKAGLHSGFMIPQYTAAALVSENKVLAHPASVDSIPTSANQEDHVSMGTIAARKAIKILENSENVIAIEFFAAAQGVDFRNPQKLGNGTKNIYSKIRKVVTYLTKDREMANDIAKVRQLVMDSVSPNN